MKAIEDEAKLRQQKHARHMILLNTKRDSDKHSDILGKIVENYSVVEFEQMTGEELIIHHFYKRFRPQNEYISYRDIANRETDSSSTQN